MKMKSTSLFISLCAAAGVQAAENIDVGRQLFVDDALIESTRGPAYPGLRDM